MTTYLIGSYAASTFVKPTTFLTILVMGFLAHYTGFALNEYMDRHLDACSPDPGVKMKPLLTGEISPKGAISSVVVATTVYLLCAMIFFPHSKALFFFLLGLISGVFYDVKGKYWPYLYDFDLSLTMALCVLAGASVVGSPISPLVLTVAILVFLETTIMNGVQNAMKDVESDRLGKVPTRAVAWNYDPTEEIRLRDPIYLYNVVLILIFFTVYLLPFLLGYTTNDYLWILIFFGIPTQLYVYRSILGKHNRDYYLKLFSFHNIVTAALVISVLYDSLGFLGFILLWLFPTVWYITSVPIIYKGSHPLKPGV